MASVDSSFPSRNIEILWILIISGKQVHKKFVRMGAKFDAATKGEYADIQGESSLCRYGVFVCTSCPAFGTFIRIEAKSRVHNLL